MGIPKFALIGIAMGLSIVSLIFVCISVAGFSMNQAVIQNTYWAGANLPKFVINDDYTVNGLNVIFAYGLRLVVQLCDGKYCNGSGDDIFEEIESTRIQSCYSVDDDANQDVCLQCRSAGLAAGSLTIINLFFVVVTVGLVGVRFVEKMDSTVIKFAGIAMSGAIMFFAFLALTVYGAQCYQTLVNDQFSNDDVIDQDNIDYYLGPGFVVLLVAMFFQPVVMILLFLAPCDNDSQESSGGQSSGGGGMATKEETNQA